jgi:GAF domain-containing protein
MTTLQETIVELRKSLRKTWDFLVAPAPAITDNSEQRIARLAASFLFTIFVFALIGGVARFTMTGRGFIESFSGGIGLTILSTLAGYGLARTKWYRAAIFLFSFSYCFIAYYSLVAAGTEGDASLLILLYVPLGLIVASTFLSGWSVFLLLGLNVGALIATRYFGAPIPNELGVQAAMITIIGTVLILLAGFRNQLEKWRFNQVEEINRSLEDLTSNLEKRVAERTAELETAKEQTDLRAGQLQNITELSETIAGFQELDQLFSSTTTLISERFGFYHVGIFLVDESREFAVLQAANSEGGKRMLARSHRLQVGTGVVGVCAQSGRPRIALDVGEDAVYFDNPDLPMTRSEAALPLKSRGKTIGVLDVQSLEAGAFTAEDLQVLTTLANQVSITLENARLLTETRAALAQVQEVYDEFTRAEWSRTISKAEQPGFRYHIGRIELLEHPLDLPEVVSAAQSGQTAPGLDSGLAEKRTQVAVPVKIRGEVIGIIHVESNDSSKVWKDDEITLVQAVAERAALAMENARLFQDARRRAAKEQAISQATTRISRAINIENILHTTAEELERVLGGSEVLIRFQDKERS